MTTESANTPGRTCGSCYACCVYLGIEELRKYAGQACKHLRGLNDPTKRCSIYPSRPEACSAYQCVWRGGWGSDDLRPSDSGILITLYHSERSPGSSAATVSIIDMTKASRHIDKVLKSILSLPTVNEIRLVNPSEKRALLFLNGSVYDAMIIPSRDYESLDFIARDPPIGHYIVDPSDEIYKLLNLPSKRTPTP